MNFYLSLTQYSALLICLLSQLSSENVPVSKVATQGQTVKLPCRIDVDGDVRVQWLDPRNMPISSDTEITNGQNDRYSIDAAYRTDRNLVITNVHVDDAGIYRCRYSVPADNSVRVKQVSLTITVPPQITARNREQTIEMDSSGQLQCSAVGNPPPVITWFRYIGDERIGLNVTGNTFALVNVNRESAGVYECLADNGIKPTAVTKLTVDVLFAPDVDIPYREVSQHQGANTVMTCIVTANPLGSVYWQRDGQRLESTSKFLLSSFKIGNYQQMLTATINQLASSDYGVYECVAENQFGQDKEKMTVYEFEGGRIRLITAPKDTFAQENSYVLLECTVDNLSGEESLTWWYSGTKNNFQKLFESHGIVVESDAIKVAEPDRYEIVGLYNLAIKSARFRDAGFYVCDITGHANYTVELSVIGKATCADKSLLLDDGEGVRTRCTIPYSGAYDAGWRIDWIQMTTGDRMPTMKEDIAGIVRRTLSTTVQYPTDSGDYMCAVTSRRPFYVDNCTTSFIVRPEKAGNKSASCIGDGHRDAGQSYLNEGRPQTVIMLTIMLALLFVAFIVSMGFVITHYRRQIETRTRCSHCNIESVPLRPKDLPEKV